jgi:hypothetical protein
MLMMSQIDVTGIRSTGRDAACINQILEWLANATAGKT